MRTHTSQLPVPRQRPSSQIEFGLNSALIDFMIYMCPIRKTWSAAVEDRQGRWWTGADWVPGGTIWYFDSGSFELFHLPEKEHQITTIVASSGLFKECDSSYGLVINPRPELGFPDGKSFPFPKVHELICTVGWGLTCQGHQCAWDEKGEGPDQVIRGPVLAAGHDDPEYLQARILWVQEFEKSCPRPEGAVISSHAISVRTARARHAHACSRKAREKRQRLRTLYINSRKNYPNA